jgi:putative alpha-1,2-mannosidase
VWYTCAWRAARYPRRLSETDASGAEVHWSAYDGAVHAGPAATDVGAWDAYRTLFPLLALTAPEAYGWMAGGFLAAAEENGGWLPQWPSPGTRQSMVGSHM